MAAITIVHRGRNNNQIIRNNVKKYWSDYKNWGGDGREFTTTILLHKKFAILLHKKFASCPKLKIWKTIFFIFWKKSNLKNCFPNYNFGTGGELFLGEDYWRKPSSTSKFLWPILAVIDNLYRSSNWRLLFRLWSAIVVLAVIGDSYFSHYQRLLFWRQSVIVISAAIGDRWLKASPVHTVEQ